VTPARSRREVLTLFLFLLGSPLTAQDSTAAPIADNSFLVEEA
jgi:hypothetical protein